jgi:hypothetical protein
MAIWFLAYDLMNELDSSGYKELKTELQRLKAHRTQFSAWLVNLDETAQDVRAHFSNFVDSDDRLWVVRVRKREYAFNNAIGGTKQWLLKNPPD